jgi:hypothetical protein
VEPEQEEGRGSRGVGAWMFSERVLVFGFFGRRSAILSASGSPTEADKKSLTFALRQNLFLSGLLSTGLPK